MPSRDARAAGRPGTRLGRIGGVAILLTPTWPVSLAIVIAVVALLARRVLPDPSLPAVIISAVVLTGLLMAGVLLHELGHLFAARLVGQRVLRIRFDVLGGQTDLIGPATTAGRDAFVAVAGPLASALLSGVGFAVGQAFDPGTTGRLVALTVGVVNALLTVFNLLPALPLDGGEVVRTLAWRISGNRRTGTRVGYYCTALVAVALLAVAVVRWLAGDVGRMQGAILGAMAIHLGASGYAEWRRERRERSGSTSATAPSPGGPTATDPISGTRDVGSLAGPPADGNHPLPVTALSPDATVAAAAATGTAVVLVDPDGTPVAIADRRRWASAEPSGLVLDVATPHRPMAILLSGDGPAEIGRALRRLPDAEYFLVADDQGELFGVWPREVLRRILTGGDRESGRQSDSRAPGATAPPREEAT